jgi:hypothetical protein
MAPRTSPGTCTIPYTLQRRMRPQSGLEELLRSLALVDGVAVVHGARTEDLSAAERRVDAVDLRAGAEGVVGLVILGRVLGIMHLEERSRLC